jgi:Phosphotransferase system, mannose/fructose-specific component IIA
MTSNDQAQASDEGNDAPRAIVAGHGELPQGLVNAVDCISGCGSVFLALSNYGLAGSDIEGKLREKAAEYGIKVFFTDLPGGSATVAVRRMMRTDPSLVLVTGANLSTLLEFVFQPDASPADAARHATEKGRATLVVAGDTGYTASSAAGTK